MSEKIHIVYWMNYIKVLPVFMAIRSDIQDAINIADQLSKKQGATFFIGNCADFKIDSPYEKLYIVHAKNPLTVYRPSFHAIRSNEQDAISIADKLHNQQRVSFFIGNCADNLI